MAEEGKNKSRFFVLLIIAGLILVGGSAGFQVYKKLDASKLAAEAEATALELAQNAQTAQPQETPGAEGTPPASPDADVASAPVNTVDAAALTTPRILGNPNAPVKISEHSSFTCGACAAYHRSNFKQLKAEYIDTGKAYLVFDDFPRNPVDIHIGALARCIQGDAYFNFVQLMFETQQQWAKGDYKAHVKQNAMIAGLSDAQSTACMEDKTVQEALAANRQAASDKFNINSTPTLVINDRKVITGISPYAELKQAIEDELARTAQPAVETAPPAPVAP